MNKWFAKKVYECQGCGAVYSGKPAKPTCCNGEVERFDSLREHKRWKELRHLERIDEICDLKPHPSWDLEVNGQKIGRYTADFRYMAQEPCSEGSLKGTHWYAVVEDVKAKNGHLTREFRRTLKHMKAQYGIEVRIV